MQPLQYTGLNDAQVAQSRQQHGANILTPPARRPLWLQFLDKFSDPLIIILLVAGALSIGISLYEYYGLHKDGSVFFEPVGIFMAIILATGLGFFFEYKADREFAVLNQVNDDEQVQVYRNGVPTSVSKKDIVVGDIIILSTGQEIPADCRLLEAVAMSVDESTLTGEPLAHKSTDPAHFDKEATFPTDHVMRGTKVMEGHGVAEVFAVGDRTENGKVYEAATIDNSVRTPLTEQLDRLGLMISRMSYGVGVAIIVGRVITYFLSLDGPIEWFDFLAYFLQTIMIAVTLIVVAVPEGLPMAVTLSLAYSMRRMLKTNNLVRKMHACETMGATTVICTDKTGTLTQNRMQVSDTDFFGDPEVIDRGIAVNSTAQLGTDREGHTEVLGNPTEGALLLWLRDRGIDYSDLRAEAKIVEELPFSTERKYMATIVEQPDGVRRLHVKGAPEILLGLCGSIAGGVDVDMINRRLAEYQQKAMRTLALASCTLKPDESPIANGEVNALSLEFLGIAAIADPVREDVPDAIKSVLDAGIAVKIVTGDTTGTAKEIGRQIGLWRDSDTDANITTGPEVGAMTDDELRDRVMDLKIIARARPMDKKRLVEALQQRNQVVAVTGDGTNDAPALKAAHVGLSMGDGTSVAKEASDITIVDNSFTSIGRAVMWGRSLYRNIQRFVLFQMTVNIAACLLVLFGAFMGTESPLTVTQMLWVNLIMDTFAAMALASLPPSMSVMSESPRRRSDFIINRSMWTSILSIGTLFFLILIALVYVFQHSDVTSLTDLCHLHLGVAGELTPYELSLIFTIFVFLQFWNMFNARAFATNRSALHLGHCGEFMLIAAVIFVGQILIVELGGSFFNVTPLKLTDWILIIGATSLVLWIGELLRILRRK